MAGFRFVATSPFLRSLAIGWFLFLIGIGLMLVSELPMARLLGAGSLGYGIMVSGWAAGSLVGSLVARRVVARRGELPSLIWGAGSAAVALGAIGAAPWLASAAALLAVAGFLNSISAVAEETIVQRSTPDAVRSRVMAAQEAIWIAALGIGLGAGGRGARVFGPAPPTRSPACSAWRARWCWRGCCGAHRHRSPRRRGAGSARHSESAERTWYVRHNMAQRPTGPTRAEPHPGAGRAAGRRLHRHRLTGRNRRRPGSADRRARVERAIAELDYVPDERARDLRRATTRTVGIVVPSLESPLYGEVFRLVHRALQRGGSTVLMFESDDDRDAERAAVEVLVRSHARAVVVAAAGGLAPDAMQLLRRRDIRVVFFGDRPPDPRQACVCVDDHGGSRLLTEHLIALGAPAHRRCCAAR